MTPLLRLGSGACAGIIGMSATYPLDMVRGRLTVQAGKAGSREYTGILHATRMIVKQVCNLSKQSHMLVYQAGMRPPLDHCYQVCFSCPAFDHVAFRMVKQVSVPQTACKVKVYVYIH